MLVHEPGAASAAPLPSHACVSATPLLSALQCTAITSRSASCLTRRAVQACLGAPPSLPHPLPHSPPHTHQSQPTLTGWVGLHSVSSIACASEASGWFNDAACVGKNSPSPVPHGGNAPDQSNMDVSAVVRLLSGSAPGNVVRISVETGGEMLTAHSLWYPPGGQRVTSEMETMVEQYLLPFPDGRADEEGAGDAELEPLELVLAAPLFKLPLLSLLFAGGVAIVAGLAAATLGVLTLLWLWLLPDGEESGCCCWSW
jgi:hypothetical protein